MHHYPHPTIAVFFLFFVSKSLSLLVIFTSYKSELFHIKPFYFLPFLQLLSSTASLYSWQYMFLEISYKFNEILGDTVVVSIVASHHQKSIVDWLVFPHCPLCGIRCVCVTCRVYPTLWLEPSSGPCIETLHGISCMVKLKNKRRN